MAGGPGIYRGTDGRSICRGRIGSSYVRARSIHCFDARSHRAGSALQRVHRNLRSTLCHLGMRETPAILRPLRRGRLYHCRLLVYRIDVLRQPSRYDCSIREQHVCRDQTRRCSRICRRPVGRGSRGNSAFPMARPVAQNWGFSELHPSWRNGNSPSQSAWHERAARGPAVSGGLRDSSRPATVPDPGPRRPRARIPYGVPTKPTFGEGAARHRRRSVAAWRSVLRYRRPP